MYWYSSRLFFGHSWQPVWFVHGHSYRHTPTHTPPFPPVEKTRQIDLLIALLSALKLGTCYRFEVPYFISSAALSGLPNYCPIPLWTTCVQQISPKGRREVGIIERGQQRQGAGWQVGGGREAGEELRQSKEEGSFLSSAWIPLKPPNLPSQGWFFPPFIYGMHSLKPNETVNNMACPIARNM